MTAILGVSAFYHDSSAALVVDGNIVAAAQEERFTRKKHDSGFPNQAIAYCLSEGNLSPDALDYVGFYEKPLLKVDRLLETYLAFAPRGFWSFATALPSWFKEKLHVRKALDQALGKSHRHRYVYAEHHESHAASAFYPSPFASSAVLTVDGVGEWATATYGVGSEEKLELMQELRFPHSPGLLYSAFTQYCGFKVDSGEYKLMGLAPFGEPRYVDLILTRIIDLKDDGSFRLNMKYFNYCAGLTMISRNLCRLFGKPPRIPETLILDPFYMDVAASIQKVIEEIMLRMVRHVYERTGESNLCLAGGVALNCVANGRILREGPFKNLWVQPASGDAGGALGVALLIWHKLLGRVRNVNSRDSQHGSLLGPQYSSDEIERYLGEQGAAFHVLADEAALCEQVADYLADGKVVGWFQGRMEFGPRALGARSILADARSKGMQTKLNQKIKFRESFRPFAPSVIEENVADVFEWQDGLTSPYMLLVSSVSEHRRLPKAPDTEQGIGQMKQARSDVPAVTHVDYSARIQTVDAARSGRYYRLLQAFHRKTGIPLLINTSFNVRGEPIVCTPADALHCFLATDMDVLVLENCVLIKAEQPRLKLENVSHAGQSPSD